MPVQTFPFCTACCAANCCSNEPSSITVSDGTRSQVLMHVGSQQWGKTGGIGGIFGATEPGALSFRCVDGVYTLTVFGFNGTTAASAAATSCDPFAWTSPITGPDGISYVATVVE